mgnify:CR=1 FL=1
MKSLKYTLFLLATWVTFFSCRNKNVQQTEEVADTTAEAVETVAQTETIVPYKEPIFPASGKKASDFVPANYHIDMETEADLNQDGLTDMVLVLINTKDSTALRPTLILLNQDKGYKLYAKSFSAIEPKYREDGFQIYDYENIEIDNGKLVISMQATGPSGTIESEYKFLNEELVLTNIRTFNMGAGGQTEVKFDLLKGIYEQTEINTMKEDMPSTTTNKKYKIPKMLFKDSDPSEIMIKAYEKVGN